MPLTKNLLIALGFDYEENNRWIGSSLVLQKIYTYLIDNKIKLVITWDCLSNYVIHYWGEGQFPLIKIKTIEDLLSVLTADNCTPEQKQVTLAIQNM